MPGHAPICQLLTVVNVTSCGDFTAQGTGWRQAILSPLEHCILLVLLLLAGGGWSLVLMLEHAEELRVAQEAISRQEGEGEQEECSALVVAG